MDIEAAHSSDEEEEGCLSDSKQDLYEADFVRFTQLEPGSPRWAMGAKRMTSIHKLSAKHGDDSIQLERSGSRFLMVILPFAQSGGAHYVPKVARQAP